MKIIKKSLSRRVAAPLLATLVCASGVFAAEATYPTKPIRIIVPFAPGGGTDIVARIVGAKVSESWGQSVIIDNRGGGGATIGTDLIAKSAPDGYTFGSINSEQAIVPNIQKVPFDPIGDFTPLTQSVTFSYVMVVHPSIPATTVKEVIADIRAKGGRFNFGTAHFSAGHLAGELFKLRTGVPMTHIPYKGTGPAITDLLGGQISLMFSTAPPALPLVKAGKLRAIAITAAKRSSLMPDLPTVAESGVSGFEVTGWSGFVGPARIPPVIVARLNRELVRVLNLPDVRDRLYASGVEPVGNPSAVFGAHLANELKQWGGVIREAKLKLEQ